MKVVLAIDGSDFSKIAINIFDNDGNEQNKIPL